MSYSEKIKNETMFLHAGASIGALVAEKQDAYGDSFGKAGKVMEILYPDGIRPDQYCDALPMVRVIDKLFRIATKKGAFGEDPWKDICGYSLLCHSRDSKKLTAAETKEVVI